MPKCVQCNEYFPPNYTEVIPNSRPDNDGNYPQKCIFCIKGVNTVDIESSKDSGRYDMPYTREQCIKDYREFIKKIKESGKVEDIIKKTRQM